MLALLWSKITTKALEWLGIALAVLGVLFMVRKGGGDAEKADNAKNTISMQGKAHDAETKVDAMPTSAVIDELQSKWTRQD